MFTVIKLGGCNGSGKTTLARAVMAEVRQREGREWDKCGLNKKKPLGYKLDMVKGNPGIQFFVLGSYETTCGGMDTISDKEERLSLLRATCRTDRIVMFEGLITGKTYGAMGELSEKHVKSRKGRWLYAFMDTPFDVCVNRVLQRRGEAGNLKPFEPERTMRSTFRSCEHLAEKLQGTRQARPGFEVMQHPVLMINHKRKPEVEAKRLLNLAEDIQRAGF